MASILRPVDGYRGALKEKGIKPKDHFRENISAMREKQRENRLRKELNSLEEQASGSFKLKKFSHVESRIKTSRSGVATDRSGRSSGGAYLRKATGSTAGTAKKAIPRGSRPPRESTKPPVPQRNEVMPLAPREEKNFIRDNYHEAPRAPRRRTSVSSDADARREDYGEVPQYLQERKEMWAAEEQRREEEEASVCPPGMMRMADEERLETLEVLMQSLEETNKVLNTMPLKIETPGQIRRKAELDAKVKELEDAIEIFSREEVYVADE